MPPITADTVLITVGTSLSLLVVLGHMLFDIGSVRPKNVAGTIVRHLLVTTVAILGFLFMGFGLLFGGQGGFFGVLDFFTLGNYGPSLPDGVPLTLFVTSQAVVCAVVANIVCGALAERSNLTSQVAVTLALSLLIYPFVNRWTWGSGWLSQLGFHDFAGSASINMVGGIMALVASALMGPRCDKYGEDGDVRALPGQSLALCASGSLLIFVGWFGLMGVSSFAFGAKSVNALGDAFLGMVVAACASTVTSLVVTSVRYGGPDVPMALNGMVGGLVAVSAGADTMSPLAAGVVGVGAGLVVVLGVEWVERRLRVDDPVGSIATHGLCGVLGLVSCGLLSENGGLFLGGGPALLGTELLGAVAVSLWTCVFAVLVLVPTRRSADLRVLVSEEEAGLGLTGPSLNNAFAEYMPGVLPEGLGEPEVRHKPDVPPEEAVPLDLMGGAATCALREVQIVCRPMCLERLRRELAGIGVTGMTVIDVLGCGEQRGARETYRGIPVDVAFVPKVLLDVVVSKVPVEDVVAATRRALYTGHIGDGKIFVYGVAEAVKVRTGEHGCDAVQNIDAL